MNSYNKFIFLLMALFSLLFFSQSIFAVKKIIYPDAKLLQPMPEDTQSGAQETMNLKQAEIIRENLNSSKQTLDYKKLENTAKKDDNKFLEIAKKPNYIVQIIIFIMIVFFIFILGLRFFQKKQF